MKNNKKKYIIYSIIMLIIIGLSVGFSAFQTQLLIDDSIFNVRLQIDTRVSGSVVSKTGGDAVSNYEDYNVSKIYGSASFPSSSSYVLYKVDLTNYGNIKTGLLNITSNTNGINYQVCDSNGSNCSNNPKTAVCQGNSCTLGSTKAIYVKVTSTSTGTKNIDLDLDFEPYHNISYENFMENTSSFETEIMENDTYEVTFTSDVEEVNVSGSAIVNYNKNNHKLTISNVGGDIVVSAKYKLTDIAETSYTGSNPNNYVRYNDTLYRIITKENVDDGYGNTELRGKIISNTSIGNNVFDSTTNEYGESSLKDLLNGTFYNGLSTDAKELIETASWTEDYADYVGLINTTDYSSNSSWIPNEGYTLTPAEDDKINAITSGGLVASLPSVSRATYPALYLKEDVLIVGGTGTSANPYLLELSDGGLQSNPTIIRGRSLTATGSNQELVTVTNKVGTPYYSTSTQLNSSNYNSGSTSIPQATNTGTYYIYYYIPAGSNYKAKSGRVKTTINGITYTINYTKGANISEIGKTHDSCTTSGSSLTCSVILPSITPNNGWENAKWNYGSNDYNPGATYVLNSSNSGITLNSSVSGKTYVATFYFNSNTTLGELNVDTRSVSCTVQENSSCTVTVPSAVSSSIGKYNSAYTGVSRTTGNLTSGSLTLTGNQNFYAYYSSNVTYYHYGTNDYVTDTIYRNEYFTSNSATSVVLASTNNSTTSVAIDDGPGSSEYAGLSNAADTTIEYSTMSVAAQSNASSIYSVYQFDISYQKGSNVSSIGQNTDSCKVVYNSTTCSVTLPSITANTGYTSVGWSTVNGDTTGVTGSYAIYINDLVLYGNAKGNEYTATFYYNSNLTSGSLTVSTKTASCTVTSGTSCTVTVPSEVSNSVGKYNSTYVGVSNSTSTMNTSELSISNNTTEFYAIYRTPVTRYYYSSGYKSGTIYRNEYFTSESAMNTVLSTVDNGTTNYTSSRGPGSSNWLGLSVGANTTPSYNSVSAAANSSFTIFYTVYQFVINYEIGANVSAIGASSATCEVTTSDTSCVVILPSITPNTGYISAGWSLSNGDTTGEAASSVYMVSNNNRVMYANAIGANYINTTTNESYQTLQEAFDSVANNQTIKVLNNATESSKVTLESNLTGIKLDLNGKTITSSATNTSIENNGELDIYNTSSIDGTIAGSSTSLIFNNGTLTINGTSSNNKVVLNNTGAETISNVGTTTINNKTRIVGKYGVTSSGSFTMNGGEISFSDSGGIFNTGTATINNGTIIGDKYGIYNMNYGTVTINDGEITTTTDQSTSYTIYNDSSYSSITILGGTISNNYAHAVYSLGTVTLGSNDSTVSTASPIIQTTGTSGAYAVKGNAFNFYDGILKSSSGTGYSISAYPINTPSDYIIQKTTTSGIETAILVKANYINISRDEKYMTLTDALSNCNSNQTIKVLQDTSESTTATLSQDKTGVKLDLNGHTITSTANPGITNNGSLDIYNSSSTNATISTSGLYSIRNRGTLTINNTSDTNSVSINNTNGTLGYTVLNESGKSVTVNNNVNLKSNTYFAIANSGNVTMTGGILTSLERSAIHNNGTTTVTGGTIIGYLNGILSDSGTVNISGSTTQITATNSSGVGISNNSTTLTITGGNISGWYGINSNASSIANISGSSTQITGNAVGIANYGTLTISDGTITGTTNYGISNVSSATLTVTGGTIIGKNKGIAINNTSTATLGEEDSTVSITSPEIRTTATSGSYGIDINSGATFNFYDGIIKSASGTGYSINGTVNNIPNSYKIQKTTTDGIETAILVEVEHNYQNTTTEAYYETLNDAFSGVSNNQTIKVLNSKTENVRPVLQSDKTGIKLDLNGKTITVTDPTGMTNLGELDIYSSNGNGTITGSSTTAVLFNNGTLTINDTAHTNRVTISSTVASGNPLSNNTSRTLTLNENAYVTADVAGTNTRNLIYNGGTIVLNGGNISSTLTNNAGIFMGNAAARFVMNSGTINVSSLGIRNYSSTLTETPAVEIKGGGITSTASTGIYNDTTGLISIENGTVTSTTGYGIYNVTTGTINISGGTVTGTIGLYNVADGILNMTNGTLIGTASLGLYNKGTATISGGTINGVTYGAYTDSNHTLTIGDEGTPVSTTSPHITVSGTSSNYAVYVFSTGTFNYYDGLIESASGTGYAIYGTPDDITDGYKIQKTTTNGVESAILVENENIYKNITTDEYYETLTEAFSSVSSNQTIKLLKNVTEATQATLASTKTGVKLDLNGKTITTSVDNFIYNNGSLDIYNSLSTNATITSSGVNTIYNSGTLSINGISTTNTVIINNTHTTNNIGDSNAIQNLATKSVTINSNAQISSAGTGLNNLGTVTITGGTISGFTAINNSASGTVNISGNDTVITGNASTAINTAGTVTISNGTISCNTGSMCNGIYNFSDLTISGGTISANAAGILNYNNGNTTITGGTITGGSNGIQTTSGTTVTLGSNDTNVHTDSPIIQSTNTSSGYGIYNDSATFNFYDGVIKSSSGTGYSINGTVSNIPNGYYVKKTTSSGVESAILGHANYQNITTNNYFETLKEAFLGTTSNQTIKVINNTSESVVATLASTKTGVKLDLNGKTITATVNKFITNNGTLDIYNTSSTTGTITCNEIYTIYNNGTLSFNGTSNTNTIIIDNTLEGNFGTNGTSIQNCENKTVTINNNTQVTTLGDPFHNDGIGIITGGTLSGAEAAVNGETGNLTISGNSTLLVGNDDFGVHNIGTLTLNGGTIKSRSLFKGGILSRGTVTMNGGLITCIENKDCSGIHNSGTLLMTGGTINVTKTGIETNVSGVTNGETQTDYYGNTTITGGTISAGQYGATVVGETELTIGTKDSTVNTTSPLIQSTVAGNFASGVYISEEEDSSGGIFNFYDGIIKSASGAGTAIEGPIADLPNKGYVKRTLENGIESAIVEIDNTPPTINNISFTYEAFRYDLNGTNGYDKGDQYTEETDPYTTSLYSSTSPFSLDDGSTYEEGYDGPIYHPEYFNKSISANGEGIVFEPVHSYNGTGEFYFKVKEYHNSTVPGLYFGAITNYSYARGGTLINITGVDVEDDGTGVDSTNISNTRVLLMTLTDQETVTITVTDKAGNVATYNLPIKQYLWGSEGNYNKTTGTFSPNLGWVKLDWVWMYNEDHSLLPNKVHNNWYYFANTNYNGWVAGKQTIDGKEYFFALNNEYDSNDSVIYGVPMGALAYEYWYIENGYWYYYDVCDDDEPWTCSTLVKSKWVDWQHSMYGPSANGTYYLQSDGKMSTGWTQINGKWFYFSTEQNYLGQLQTGWKEINDNWYYLYPEEGSGHLKGEMATGWQDILIEAPSTYYTYYFQDNGVMKKGWLNLDGTYYYFDETNGRMQTGWLQYNNKWYYLYPSTESTHSKGQMATGWISLSGDWYYLYTSADSNHDIGEMATGWVKVGNYWYYLQGDGKLKTGWLQYNNYWYYLFPDNSYGPPGGSMAVSATYTISGTSYTFDSSGHCTNHP